jgi:hypothetical protein
MMPTLKARRRASACVPFTHFGVTAFRRRLDPVVAAWSRTTDAPIRFAVAAQRERPLDWDLQVRLFRGHRQPVSRCLCVHERTCSSAFRRVEKIAKARGVSMAQIALAWLLSKDGAPVTFNMLCLPCLADSLASGLCPYLRNVVARETARSGGRCGSKAHRGGD